jgi:hypothetical protein
MIATDELDEKPGIDIQQEMDRFLEFEELYKQEVKTN